MTGSEELADLLAKTGLGDRAAFRRLYDRTSSKLYTVALRILKDSGLAEDVLQDSYVKIWHAAARYTPGGARPMTWLITIVRHASIDKLRMRRNPEVGTEVAEQLPAQNPSPEASAIALSEAQRIIACLDELKPDHRAAVRGAYLEGLSYADLAQQHDIPLNTIRTWLRRSLQTLRACMTR